MMASPIKTDGQSYKKCSDTIWTIRRQPIVTQTAPKLDSDIVKTVLQGKQCAQNPISA